MGWEAATEVGSQAVDWTLVWTIMGVLVAVIVGVLGIVGLVFQIVGHFRDHPKRRLEYTVRSTPLVQGVESDDVEVRVKGTPIRNPHSVQFSLTANSRADIPSTAFDGARPLVFRVEPGASVLGDVLGEGEIKLKSGEWDSEHTYAEFAIAPQLIKPKSRLSLKFVSSGPPSVQFKQTMIGIDVVDVTRRPQRADLTMSLIMTALYLMIVVFTIWIATNTSGGGVEQNWWPGATWLVGFAILVVGGFVVRDLIGKFGWRQSRR